MCEFNACSYYDRCDHGTCDYSKTDDQNNDNQKPDFDNIDEKSDFVDDNNHQGSNHQAFNHSGNNNHPVTLSAMCQRLSRRSKQKTRNKLFGCLQGSKHNHSKTNAIFNNNCSQNQTHDHD